MEPTPVATTKAKQESVTINCKYGQEDWSPFFAFEKVIENSFAKSAVGDYDGNLLAVGGRDGYMYFFGPSVDALFDVLKPHTLGARFLKRIEVTLHYGQVADQSAHESTIHPWQVLPLQVGVLKFPIPRWRRNRSRVVGD